MSTSRHGESMQDIYYKNFLSSNTRFKNTSQLKRCMKKLDQKTFFFTTEIKIETVKVLCKR